MEPEERVCRLYCSHYVNILGLILQDSSSYSKVDGVTNLSCLIIYAFKF
jgi:hypothetical protein